MDGKPLLYRDRLKMSMSSPKVSVLMSIYNGERYLREAVESILGQTFTDYEFVIVDDGSTDRTRDILNEYTAHDDRFVLIYNTTNLGLTKSLNKGLAIARGEYIARMDADDVSLPYRLARQVKFMDNHPAVGVVGSVIQYTDEAGKVSDSISVHDGSAGMLRWWLCFENPLRHPTVMMRRAVVNQVGGYNATIPLSQDYDLWQRMSDIAELANLPEVLLYRRKHHHSVSIQQAEVQLQNSITNSQRTMSRILGQEIPLRLVKQARYQELTSLYDGPVIATLIYRLAVACVSHPSLSDDEKQQIRREAGRRILRLFFPNRAHWRTWVLPLLAWRLDSGLVITAIRNGIRRRLRK
jgi:hypothetical protein